MIENKKTTKNYTIIIGNLGIETPKQNQVAYLMRINGTRWKGATIPKELISHRKSIIARVRSYNKIRVSSIFISHSK